MGATLHFEEPLRGRNNDGSVGEMDIEVGTSTFFTGQRDMYVRSGKEALVLDKLEARRFAEAVVSAARQMGIDDL